LAHLYGKKAAPRAARHDASAAAVIAGHPVSGDQFSISEISDFRSPSTSNLVDSGGGCSLQISPKPTISECVTHPLQGIDFVRVESGENSHGRRYDFRAVSGDFPFYLKSSASAANRSKEERYAGQLRTLRLAGRSR
jgi:hypothetical protein